MKHPKIRIKTHRMISRFYHTYMITEWLWSRFIWLFKLGQATFFRTYISMARCKTQSSWDNMSIDQIRDCSLASNSINASFYNETREDIQNHFNETSLTLASFRSRLSSAVKSSSREYGMHPTHWILRPGAQDPSWSAVKAIIPGLKIYITSMYNDGRPTDGRYSLQDNYLTPSAPQRHENYVRCSTKTAFILDLNYENSLRPAIKIAETRPWHAAQWHVATRQKDNDLVWRCQRPSKITVGSHCSSTSSPVPPCPHALPMLVVCF